MGEEGKTRQTRWLVVWTAFGAGIVAAMHIGKLPPALPDVRAELGAGLVMGGWIASMISCTGFAIGLIAGSIADRLGQRRVLLTGLCFLAAGSLLGAFVTTGLEMLFARFLEGVGFTAATITGAGIIVRVTSGDDRRWALGVWSSYLPCGFAGMMIVGALVHDHVGWRTLWIFCTVVTLLWAVAVYFVTADWQRRQVGEIAPEPLWRNISRTLATPGAVLASACFALYAAQHISMMNWLPTYLEETRGAATLLAAIVPATVLMFNAGGNWIAARLMGRGTATWVLLFGGALGMAACEIGLFSPAVPDGARLALALAFGIAGGLIPAAVLGSVATYTPSPAQIGTMNGLMVMGTNTGQLFGPPALAAARQSAGSWEGALPLVLALAVLGAVLALASRSMERRAAKR